MPWVSLVRKKWRLVAALAVVVAVCGVIVHDGRIKLPSAADLAVVVAVCGVIVFGRRSGPVPAICLVVKRYSKDVYPLASPALPEPCIWVDLELKNIGREVVFCGGWRTIPQSSAVIGSAGLNSDSELLNPGGELLNPNDVSPFYIRLPDKTARWQAGLSFKILTARQRTTLRFDSLAWFPGILKPLAYRTLRFWSDNREPFYLETDPMEVTDGPNGLPRTYPLHPVAAPGH